MRQEFYWFRDENRPSNCQTSGALGNWPLVQISLTSQRRKPNENLGEAKRSESNRFWDEKNLSNTVNYSRIVPIPWQKQRFKLSNMANAWKDEAKTPPIPRWKQTVTMSNTVSSWKLAMGSEFYRLHYKNEQPNCQTLGEYSNAGHGTRTYSELIQWLIHVNKLTKLQTPRALRNHTDSATKKNIKLSNTTKSRQLAMRSKFYRFREENKPQQALRALGNWLLDSATKTNRQKLSNTVSTWKLPWGQNSIDSARKTNRQTAWALEHRSRGQNCIVLAKKTSNQTIKHHKLLETQNSADSATKTNHHELSK